MLPQYLIRMEMSTIKSTDFSGAEGRESDGRPVAFTSAAHSCLPAACLPPGYGGGRRRGGGGGGIRRFFAALNRIRIKSVLEFSTRFQSVELFSRSLIIN